MISKDKNFELKKLEKKYSKGTQKSRHSKVLGSFQERLSKFNQKLVNQRNF
jgi:hypothetical protein